MYAYTCTHTHTHTHKEPLPRFMVLRLSLGVLGPMECGRVPPFPSLLGVEGGSESPGWGDLQGVLGWRLDLLVLLLVCCHPSLFLLLLFLLWYRLRSGCKDVMQRKLGGIRQRCQHGRWDPPTFYCYTCHGNKGIHGCIELLNLVLTIFT